MCTDSVADMSITGYETLCIVPTPCRVSFNNLVMGGAKGAYNGEVGGKIGGMVKERD